MHFPVSAKLKYSLILSLLGINLLVGLFAFRDYGLTWDEPLFYDYAEALGYAYSPHEWFSGEFNLDNAFGASASDHANRGPAYLLLARAPAAWLQILGLDKASAWHLVNFFTFQAGVLGIYFLCLRLIKPWPAISAAALFSYQPLLWGHAFINSKDIPFLVFFTLSIWAGLAMTETFFEETGKWRQLSLDLLSGILLGITTSIRVLGPFAGILVVVYGLLAFARYRKSNPSSRLLLTRFLFRLLIPYVLISVAVMWLTWPYLWPDPLARFIEVFRFMSANPTELAVLFNGEIFQADQLPRRYMPSLLALTLTEPVWPLFITGIILTLGQKIKIPNIMGRGSFRPEMREGPVTFSLHLPDFKYWLWLAWFSIPFLYVVLKKPPMYDGYRHFLFILPPVFILCGLAFQKLFEVLDKTWRNAVLLFIVLSPGIINAVQLHPYEYAYYNSLVGGTGGAFRRFETDYWLTCYKEAIESLTTVTNQEINLFVRREPLLAAYYAPGKVTIRDFRVEFNKMEPGDYYLVNTRSNEDLKSFRNLPGIIKVGRVGADFCFIKKIP